MSVAEDLFPEKEQNIGSETINSLKALNDSTNFTEYTNNDNRLTTVYIQNVTITSNATYTADLIKVGSNVTNTQTSGPVYFNSGTITLSGQTVEIYGETTIAVGTTFTIVTN